MSKLYILFRTAILCSFFTLTAEVCRAQAIADTLHLPQIEVVGTRIHQPRQLQPVHVNIIDSVRLSLAKNEDIGQMLSMNSALFIKSEGPGALADASQQGLAPEQIQILWEGIPLNHAMLGLTDLSLLPTSFFSDVQVSAGVPSSSFGGELSGGIYLHSAFGESNQLSVSQSAGSYGRFHSGLNASAHGGRWQASLHSQYINDENNYRYFNQAYDQVKRRQHNHQEQKNVMASAGYDDGKNQLKTTLWYAGSQNQLPGNVLVRHSQAHQDDGALRWLTQYHTHIGKAQITAKNYLGRVTLNYFDPSIDTKSYSTSRRWIGSVNIRYPLLRQVELKGALRAGLNGVETNNYSSLKVRKQFSALLNPDLSLFRHRLHIYPAIRFDSYSDFGNVVSPSLGLNYALIRNKLYLRGQLSRNFNPPTFNALYWSPGGHPDLEPERSNNAQAGIAAALSNNIVNKVSLTGFYDRVHNGIRWYPSTEGPYSEPLNIQDISSKGVKLHTVSNFHPGGGVSLKYLQTGLWTRTEIVKPRFSGDEGVGKQMRYIPEWRYKAGLIIQKSFFTALVHYRWVGRRYVTETENSKQSLDPYQRLDAALQARRRWIGLTFTGNLQLSNLLNADYAVIQWYAMPRRNIQFTLTITYQF
jgi:iron complex outermembrane receptor protein